MDISDSEENPSCPCAEEHGDWESEQALFNRLISIRDNCPALKQVIIPDEIWGEYSRLAQQPYDKARHGYVIMLSLKTGRLPQWTLPVHDFLLTNSQCKPELSPQYRTDLQERWMLSSTETERHERYKKFVGKHIEIQFAEWLQKQGWEIIGLEALGAANDIQALHSNVSHALEIKYLQQQTPSFEESVEALSTGRIKLTSKNDPCGARNWLIYRAYQAAKQFRNTEAGFRKIAIIVISKLAWHPNYEILHFQGRGEGFDGIDWNNPSFGGDSTEWNEWFIQQTDKPDSAALKNLICSLDELWILCDPHSEGPKKEFEWIQKVSF